MEFLVSLSVLAGLSSVAMGIGLLSGWMIGLGLEKMVKQNWYHRWCIKVNGVETFEEALELNR